MSSYVPRHDQRPIAAGLLADFVKAGNSTFTVVSRATGVRFTLRVRQPKPDAPHFVSVLTGPDNGAAYTFVGSLFSDGSYRHGRRSRISESAPSAKACAWLFRNLADPLALTKVEVWHEGKCCRCGRALTVPHSIESGIGPECAKHVAVPAVPTSTSSL